MVARERFELSSRAPEAPMLDRYTTGLQHTSSKHRFYVITLALHYVEFFSLVASLTQWQYWFTGFQSPQHHKVSTMGSLFFE